METRQKIWDFYHQKSLPSTITSRPAKLRLIHVLNQSIKVLYQDFVKAYPNDPVSYGTFLTLKPFYI